MDPRPKRAKGASIRLGFRAAFAGETSSPLAGGPVRRQAWLSSLSKNASVAKRAQTVKVGSSDDDE
jgi:hypothetical protein